jgi:hypothetical protein
MLKEQDASHSTLPLELALLVVYGRYDGRGGTFATLEAIVVFVNRCQILFYHCAFICCCL